MLLSTLSLFFFFNDTATTEIYTLSLHDALPICSLSTSRNKRLRPRTAARWGASTSTLSANTPRSEEHTSELQSQSNLVCRLLLEKKKKKNKKQQSTRETITDRACTHTNATAHVR